MTNQNPSSEIKVVVFLLKRVEESFKRIEVLETELNNIIGEK